MASYQTGEFTGESKPCEQCEGPVRRRVGQNGVNWTNRRFCSRACSDAAKVLPAPSHDLVDQVFGSWVVRSYAGRNARSRHVWNVGCKCGGSAVVEDSALKGGSSKSCGCAQRAAVAAAAKANITHGMSRNTPEYHVWCSMRQRCRDPKVRNWADYGGRGIVVCERWRASFEAFYEDMGPRPTPRHSLDRLNNDGNYEPSNCRWRLVEDQNRNKRSNIYVVVDGRRLILSDAAREAGVKFTTALARYRKGWDVDRVLEPVK